LTTWLDGVKCSKNTTKESFLANLLWKRIKKRMAESLRLLVNDETWENLLIEQNKYKNDWFGLAHRSWEGGNCILYPSYPCPGTWSGVSCLKSKIAKPFDSHEERINFATWEFDHDVRIATIKKVVKKIELSKLNLERVVFYYISTKNGSIRCRSCHKRVSAHNDIEDEKKLMEEFQK